jgi:hypothetical protein
LITTAQQLPNIPELLFYIQEHKRILLHIFPTKWVTNFVNAGASTSSKTLQSIERYTAMQEALDPPSKEKPMPSIKATTIMNGQDHCCNNRKNNSGGAG